MKLSNPPSAGLGLWLWQKTGIPQLLLPGQKNACSPHPSKNANFPWTGKLSHSSCGKSENLTPQLWEKPDICGALTIWAARRLWGKGVLAEICIVGGAKHGNAAL